MTKKDKPRPRQRVAVKKTNPKKKAAKPVKRVQKPKAPTGEALFQSLPMKQRQFVLEYLANGFNATQAAITAGYAAKSADTQGSRLLANPKIKAVLAERAQKITAKRELTAESVLAEIAKMAFFDPRKMFRPDGTLIPVTDLEDDEAAAIAGVEVIQMKGSGRGSKKQPGPVLKKIKFADKGANCERLGRYFKLFVERVEHSADKEFVLTVKSILKGRK